MKTLFALLLVSATASSSPLIISHRGASYWAPEETRPSYLLAAKLSGDFWEMDIQRTKDNVLVAIHDLTLKRTTNVAEVFPGRENDPIEKFTWGDLQKLNATKGFTRASFKEVKILSLAQIIDLATESGYSGGLYVETKNPERYPGIEEEMLSLFREKGWLDSRNRPLKNLILQSFGRESLLIFKSKAPEIPATYLISDRDFVHWLNDIAFAKENKFILGPPKALFNVPLVKQRLLKSGLPIHGWTVDSVKGMESAQKLNFAGIFTNRTDLAIQIYRKAPPPDIDSLLKSLGY